jgi:thiol-disulfide isomerase/thioredoxin
MLPSNIEAHQVEAFDKLVHKYPLVIAKFFLPNCGFCIELGPIWEKLMKDKDIKSLNIPIVSVHSGAVNKSKSPCIKTIEGVPTIMAIKKGGIMKAKYNGENTYDGIKNFILNNVKQSRDDRVKRQAATRRRRRRRQWGYQGKSKKKRGLHRKQVKSRKPFYLF